MRNIYNEFEKKIYKISELLRDLNSSINYVLRLCTTHIGVV
jgi:hypothetical protein